MDSFISRAIFEYDYSRNVIQYLLDKCKLKTEYTQSNTKRSKYIFIDKESDNIILETEIEILGIFDIENKIWIWSWGQFGFFNSEVSLMNKLLKYSLDLENNMSYIKLLLTTSRGIINDSTQIEINIALAASLLKQPYIYPFYGDETTNTPKSVVYYIILLKKEELDDMNKKIIAKNEYIY